MTSSMLVAPKRDIVFAEEVEPGSGKYLVTLICGHKLGTKLKLASYKCFECPKEMQDVPEE